jgi:hypothetical protein
MTTAMREWALDEAAKVIRSLCTSGYIEDSFTDATDQDFAQRELGRLAYRLREQAEIRACKVCGCSEEDACEEGCSWIAADLCSSCAPTPAPKKKRSRR